MFYEHLDNKEHENYDNIIEVLILLACCHTVIVDSSGEKSVYNSSSPDELALVNAAKFFGVKFIDRDSSNNILI